MRKIDFFNDLENALKMLKVEKIDEILRDYEEIFIESAQAGQTEEQIIESLGEPLEIAYNYFNSSTNRNIKEEKQVVKYNKTVVTGRCVMYTMMFVMFFVATFVLYAVEKSVVGIVIMLLIDALFIPFIVLEFKKLKKYKKAQKELNNITKKDI